MRVGLPAMAAWVCVSSVTTAGELDVVVVDLHGAPATDAVVSVHGRGAPPAREAVTRAIDQHDETFIPYVEVFRPGDRVVFHNSDRTRHHVYSFAPAKSFEFVIAPGGETPPVVLDRTGEIAVGCNIHDRMITHLYVSDAPWIAKSDARGRAVFDALPAGRYTVSVWHPQLRPGKAEPEQAIDVGGEAASLRFSLPLLADPRPDPDDRERTRY
ncbi:plastocyanin [Dokdonella fugitiva]|jgi:plastocyanin|uniref:Plastocyanin n=1 Tax=Dokdonella fugitiva TaxID=328517 RepID=A0A4R2I9G6_9GAMM|nr:plastocyanin [Dokdonella fugitiva]